MNLMTVMPPKGGTPILGRGKGTLTSVSLLWCPLVDLFFCEPIVNIANTLNKVLDKAVQLFHKHNYQQPILRYLIK